MNETNKKIFDELLDEDIYFAEELNLLHRIYYLCVIDDNKTENELEEKLNSMADIVCEYYYMEDFKREIKAFLSK